MNEKCLILIDDSNFYFKLKSLGLHQLLSLDFGKLASYLARSKEIVSSRYYIGKIRQDGTKQTDKMLAGQQKLFAKLKHNHFEYVLGYLLKSDGRFHEKGVDVHIAVDMLEAAYENTCDRIILVSSDTDLEPAIRKAIKRGKVVEYVGFSHQPSIAMVRFCTESTLLKKEDILPFLQ